MTRPTAAAPRPPGWWYPRIFIGGMAVVVAVNLVLVYFAVSTFTGLETTDHYRKGLAYNQALAAAAQQAERGWTMALALSAAPQPEGGRGGELAVDFADRSGQPLADLVVTATLIRPTQAGFDVSAPLVHRGGGRYAAPVTVALPGQWDARILARRGGEAFQETRRILVP